jgi:hypothetical protein
VTQEGEAHNVLGLGLFARFSFTSLLLDLGKISNPSPVIVAEVQEFFAFFSRRCNSIWSLIKT